jgi:AraC-like DNA-binding protein
MMRHGGGPRTRIVCGYLGSGDLIFRPAFRALPPLIHFRPASPAASEWLRASARYALDETGRCTGFAARLPELLLIDCLRQYIRELPPGATGLLAALRDPVLGRALSLLHEAPEQAWTVAALARRVGVSRTVLGERFAAALGTPPMRYLAEFRLQLASHELRSGTATLPEIAAGAGYDSQAAFSRAFKRRMGQPPAAWRRTSRATLRT